MKLKNILMLLALAMGTFAFVACGDEEEQQPQDQGQVSKANKEVVGTYTGWTHLTTNFIDKNYDGDTFTLKLEEDGTLTGTFVNKIWGTATLKGINAKNEDWDLYSLHGGEGSFVMNNPRDNSTQEFGCKLKDAYINPEVKKMSIIIVANMTTEGAHGEMTFTFQTGEMPAEE